MAGVLKVHVLAAALVFSVPPPARSSEQCRIRLHTLGTELGGKIRELHQAIKTAPEITRIEFRVAFGLAQDGVFVAAKVEQVEDALFLLQLTGCNREGRARARAYVSELMSTTASVLEATAQQMFVDAGDAEDIGVLRAAAAIQEQTRRAAQVIDECRPRP
jgi:hypothetical protein